MAGTAFPLAVVQTAVRSAQETLNPLSASDVVAWKRGAADADPV